MHLLFLIFMHKLLPLITALCTTLIPVVSHAHGSNSDHKHHHEKVKRGPNGGRLIQNVTPQAEFLVLKNGIIQITFYDEKMKVEKPSTQTVTVVAGDSTLNFAIKGDRMLSKQRLPKGNKLATEVRIKQFENAREVVTKFTIVRK